MGAQPPSEERDGARTPNAAAFLSRARRGVSLALAAPRRRFAQAAKVAPITMVINQSPWFDGFRKLVEQYQKETGNQDPARRQSLRGRAGEDPQLAARVAGNYDLLAIDNNWMVEMFAGGFLMPIRRGRSGLQARSRRQHLRRHDLLERQAEGFDPKGGKLIGVPINGNVEVLFYRKDLYDQHGLKAPETVERGAREPTALNAPPGRLRLRPSRRPRLGDSPTSRTTCSASAATSSRTRVRGTTASCSTARRTGARSSSTCALGKAGGYPSPGSISQGTMIQLMPTGKAAQTVAIVGAWAQLDDPNKSAVVGKFEAALIPRGEGGKHATRAGHWIGAIARNVPKERQQAALTFLKWFQTPATSSRTRATARCRSAPTSRPPSSRRIRPPLPQGAGRQFEGGEDVRRAGGPADVRDLACGSTMLSSARRRRTLNGGAPRCTS